MVDHPVIATYREMDKMSEENKPSDINNLFSGIDTSIDELNKAREEIHKSQIAGNAPPGSTTLSDLTDPSKMEGSQSEEKPKADVGGIVNIAPVERKMVPQPRVISEKTKLEMERGRKALEERRKRQEVSNG